MQELRWGLFPGLLWLVLGFSDIPGKMQFHCIFPSPHKMIVRNFNNMYFLDKYAQYAMLDTIKDTKEMKPSIPMFRNVQIHYEEIKKSIHNHK